MAARKRKVAEKSGVNINELLTQALDANEKELTAERVEEAPVPEAQTPLEKHEKTAESDSSGEIDSLMRRYSSKKAQEDDFNTKRLREMLSKQIEGDKELSSYYYGVQSRMGSKKVKEIYTIINAHDIDVPEEKPLTQVNESSSRLSDALDTEAETFVQEKLFDVPEPVGSTESTHSTASVFDTAYVKLSDKIESGELEIDPETDEAQITFGIDEEGKQIGSEFEAVDTTDINLKLAFDMMEANDDFGIFPGAGGTAEIKEKKKRVKREEEEHVSFEYTSKEQNDDVVLMLKKAITQSMRRFGVVALLFLAVLFVEIGAESPERSVFLKPGRYGALYILVDLQLLFFIVITMTDSVKHGIKHIIASRLTTDSLLVFALAYPAIHCIVSLIFSATDPQLRLFCFPAAAAALCAALVKYLQCKKDYHCFRIIAADKSKYVAFQLQSNASEADEFYKYLIDDSDLYTVKKARFIEGFFKRTVRRPKSEDVFAFIIPMLVLFAALVFVADFYFTRNAYSAFTASAMLVATALPLTSFFMISLPLIAANRLGKRYASAFIGSAVAEEYAGASVISFADTEVFPAKLVKITSIKTFGDYRIDHTITDLANIFGTLGGPLKTVLNSAIDSRIDESATVRLIESATDGICVSLNGHEYCIGKKSYMRRYNFHPPASQTDSACEASGGSVMYVAVDDDVAAKLYLKYTINPAFDKLLNELYRAGMCVGVKTLDPNIDKALLARTVKFDRCPIAILKSSSLEDASAICEKADSGIVSAASLHTFLKMFIICDKARHATKSNAIINLAGFFLSFFVVMFLVITGDAANFSSIQAVLMQLLWLLPAGVLSFLL